MTEGNEGEDASGSRGPPRNGNDDGSDDGSDRSEASRDDSDPEVAEIIDPLASESDES